MASPSPKKRAERLVRLDFKSPHTRPDPDDEASLIVCGQRVTDWDQAVFQAQLQDDLRRILTRELTRAANARARRELRNVAERLEEEASKAQGCGSDEWAAALDVAVGIVEKHARQLGKRKAKR